MSPITPERSLPPFRPTGQAGAARVALAASAILHAGLFVLVPLATELTRPAPRVDVAEPVSVELVQESPSGRLPLGSDLPLVRAEAALPPPALASVAAADAALPPVAAPEDSQSAPPHAEALRAGPPPEPAAPAMPLPEAMAAAASPAAAEIAPAAAASASELAPPPAPIEAAGVPASIEAAPTAPIPVAAAVPSAPPASASAEVSAAAVPFVAPPAVEVPIPAALALVPSGASPAQAAPEPAIQAPAVAAASLPEAVAPLAAAPEAVRPFDPGPAVAAALSGLACARVSARYDPASGGLALRGHARSAEERGRLVAQLGGIPGIARVEADAVAIVGEPYCRVLTVLDRPELQLSAEQRDDLLVAGNPNAPGVRRLAGGDVLDLALTAPAFDAHLLVDYFSADGRVTHLAPVDRATLALKADEVLRLGRDGRSRRAVISPPFGLDVVVVLASSEPFFTAARRPVEDAAEYLAEIERAIARRAGSGIRYEYGYYLLVTGPAAGKTN